INMASLKAQKHSLSDSFMQLEVLSKSPDGKNITAFHNKLADSGLYPLKPTGIDIFQVNMGKMCNQTCKHCHVDAGPDRKEIMSREVMQLCLDAIRKSNV